ncbi:phospholipid N-methyltransferase [Phyllobacterium sp. 1468]|uniref:class I SAM-dependent methyltransferase n=1 Tax=Phyllobacterium sp. 1468 TaxID=2817759 RepID=UPI002858BE2D|nr:SAM-dependent methyltransferase [Phyllobacterium sp. 1468]MDR6633564.1 phospholipid N-methyltransferase [Phyllobacterium sp. 1468]
MTTSDVWTFIRALITNPSRVSAIAPSSAALARLITSEIGAASGPVLELGPGTGVFTDALLARGVSPGNLTLIEYGAEFARLLQTRFPGMRILQMDASQIGGQDLFKAEPAGAVVSGLPFLSMPDKVAAILDGAFSNLRNDGAFYQFTYGFRCPVPAAVLNGLDLEAVCIGRAFCNLPPAAVYRITRRGVEIKQTIG